MRPTSREEAVTRLRSAGGVVVKGSGDDLRIALLHAGGGGWVLPKGGVEEGETEQEAAQREVGEELGIRATVYLGDLGRTEHSFRQEGRLYRKQVQWFLLRAGTDAALAPNPDENALDCGWFSPKQALSLLSHSDQRRVLRRALSLLR